MAELPEQIVTGPEELAACCEYLTGCKHFGLDTEFVGEDSYHSHLCLVQVATDDRLILIDPLSTGPLDAFWKLVVDPERKVIVHAGREEIRLCQLWSGSTPGNIFDLQIAAGLVGMPYPLSHGNLVAKILGVMLSKGETLTEWRDRPLTRRQVEYAFDDVRYLLPLWRSLSEQLKQLNREDWAREEFARLTAIAVREDSALAPGSERWRKLRGIGSLDRRRLAIVRALFDWREQKAAEKNRPARSIIRDDLIPEIVRRNPSRRGDLEVMRGLPHRDLDAILQVVREARAVPLDECPLLPERELEVSQLGLVTGVIQAVLGDLCVRKRLAPNLVGTAHEIKLLVRTRYQGTPLPDMQLAKGWRAEHILPELERVLDGKRGLRIADLSSAAPFEYQETDETNR